MKIDIGTPLVHPVHGPTVLVDVVSRKIGGVAEDYAVLEHTEQDLVLQLPVDTLDDHELRPALEEHEAEDVLELLESEPEGQELTWRRMRTRNQAKLTSGETVDVAMVVRDLSGKLARKGLSPSERTMLRRATDRLVAELDLAFDDAEATEERVTKILETISEEHGSDD